MPHDSPSHSAGSVYDAMAAPVDAAQLDLFAPDEADDADDLTADGECEDESVVGLEPSIARALIPPGWWAYVRPVFAPPPGLGFTVWICETVDGRLVLDASPGPSGWSQSEVDDYVRQICARVESVCGCCGGWAARPRLAFGAPPRVACDACWERLRAGASVLEVADNHFRLDGERRSEGSRASVAPGPSSVASWGAPTPRRELGSPLPPDELRALVARLRERMRRDVIGQDEAVDRFALNAALHLGGGLERGPRMLLLGPTGVGKTTILNSVRAAIAECAPAYGFPIPPWAVIDAIDLTSPGWSGAVSIGTLVGAAIGTEDPDGPTARRAVVVIDELHHVRARDDATGNMSAKRQEVLSSLLAVAGGGVTNLGEGRAQAWSSAQAMVVASGAFTGLLDLTRTPTADDLAGRGGIPLELATRLTEDVVRLRPFDESRLVALLRRWPALTSLAAVCARLGYEVRIDDTALRYAACAVVRGGGGSTPRTAGGWLVAAVRRALDRALADDSPPGELTIAPDDLSIPPAATRAPDPKRSGDDPPGDGWGDATTIIVVPR